MKIRVSIKVELNGQKLEYAAEGDTTELFSADPMTGLSPRNFVEEELLAEALFRAAWKAKKQ